MYSFLHKQILEQDEIDNFHKMYQEEHNYIDHQTTKVLLCFCFFYFVKVQFI